MVSLGFSGDAYSQTSLTCDQVADVPAITSATQLSFPHCHLALVISSMDTLQRYVMLFKSRATKDSRIEEILLDGD